MKFTKFIKPELEQIKENANFTEEEERIFSLLCRGFSQANIRKRKSITKNDRVQSKRYQGQNRKNGGI